MSLWQGSDVEGYLAASHTLYFSWLVPLVSWEREKEGKLWVWEREREREKRACCHAARNRTALCRPGPPLFRTIRGIPFSLHCRFHRTALARWPSLSYADISVSSFDSRLLTIKQFEPTSRGFDRCSLYGVYSFQNWDTRGRLNGKPVLKKKKNEKCYFLF